MVQEAHYTLRRSLQERKGACRVVGGKAAGREETRLRRAEVPRVDTDSKDHQESHFATQVQGMQ